MDAKAEVIDIPPVDNIRTLVYYLGLAIDARLSEARRGTPYEHVRPSDVRLFVTAGRKVQTISEVARELGITRQAAQMGVHRLLKLKVVELLSGPDNKRDKLVHITPKGQLARNSAGMQIEKLEAEFATIIGVEGVATFRENLMALLSATRALNHADAEKASSSI